jgi:hypothetical protein
MPYTRDHFDLQLRFARLVAQRLGLDFYEVVRDYTTFTVNLGTEDWEEYIAGLAKASDASEATEWTYAFYLPRIGQVATPKTTQYYGNPLFGCFYPTLEEGHFARTHFIPNDAPEPGPLNEERVPARQQELCALFQYLRQNVPAADMVRGYSWLYNLDAYRRLFPPEYTAQMEVSETDGFRWMARWGQFFDRYGYLKAPLAEAFFHRLERITHPDELRRCFPFQILCPCSPIALFFDFYGIH